MSSSTPEPMPELSTTRTGGRSARVAAVAFVAVLATVIYVGVSGQNEQTRPSAAPSNAVAVASPSRSPQRSLPHVDSIQAIRADPDAPVRYQYLGARLSLGGHSTLAILDPVADDQYEVAYRIPYPLVVPSADLNVSTVTDTVSHDDFDVLGEWSFPMSTILDPNASTSMVVLAANEPPSSRTLANPTFTQVARNGFRITVTSENKPDGRLLTVSIRVAATTQPAPRPSPAAFPDEGYSVVVKVAGSTYETVPSSLESQPGHFHGEVLLPHRLDARGVTLELSAIPASDPLLGRVVFASYSVPVWRIADHAQVTNFTSPGGPYNPGLPHIALLGYKLRVLWAFDGNARAIFWDLVVGTGTQEPPSQASASSHWVTGEDGLIGYPHVGPSTPMSVTR